MKTLNDLVKQLNSYFRVVCKAGVSKIHTHSDLHEYIKDAVLSSNLLPARFNITTWEIEFYTGFGDNERKHVVIQYRRDFVQYKYCKYASRGNFSNVKFKVEPKLKNVEILKLDEYFAAEARRNSIEYYEKVIKEGKEKIAEAEAKLLRLLNTK